MLIQLTEDLEKSKGENTHHLYKLGGEILSFHYSFLTATLNVLYLRYTDI